MLGVENYDMGLKEDTRVSAVAQQLQHNRVFRHLRNNQGMPITPQILEQPAGAPKPFSELEALIIDKALDTHGYVYAAKDGRLIPHILDGWNEEDSQEPSIDVTSR